MKWQSVVDFFRIAHYRNLEPYSLSEIILFCFVTELHVYMNGFKCEMYGMTHSSKR